jgi:Arc/MetJ-type ribon-helix-helix transcriptional regulator
MYDDVHRAKGEAMAEITLDLPEELIAELESRAEKSGKNTSELVREALELYFRQRPVRKLRGDISDRPEVRRAIQIQAETRRRLEGSGYSGSAVVRQMRDRDNPKYED